MPGDMLGEATASQWWHWPHEPLRRVTSPTLVMPGAWGALSPHSPCRPGCVGLFPPQSLLSRSIASTADEVERDYTSNLVHLFDVIRAPALCLH